MLLRTVELEKAVVGSPRKLIHHIFFATINDGHIVAVDANLEIFVSAGNSGISIGGKHHADRLSKFRVGNVVFAVVNINWVDKDDIVFFASCR